MALAPTMTPVAHQEPPECPTENLPNEILFLIFNFIVQDDHTRSDVVSLLLVNKYFHDHLKKRIRSHIRILHGQELHPASDGAIMPLRTDACLPSMLRYLVMCHHGPCADDQHRLGLTSPNLDIHTLSIIPSFINLDLQCQDSEEATCTPLPILRPRTMVISGPGFTAEGRVHQGVVTDAVHRLVHIMCRPTIANIGITIKGIQWYLREFNKAEEVVVFFPPNEEEPEREGYDDLELHQFFVLSMKIRLLLKAYWVMMLCNKHFQLTFVNAGTFHSFVVRHFCEQGLPTTPTTVERQHAVSSWFYRKVARRHSELQAEKIMQRVRFITLEEYDEEA